MSGFLLHASLIIYALAGYVAEPAVCFLKSSGRQRHWPDESEQELEVIVENAFLAMDVDELARLTDREDPSEPAAMLKTASLVEEWRLAVWVRRLNSEQGVAPITGSVLQRKEERRASLPEGSRPRAVGSSAQAKARMWCRRWRLRWGGRHARIRLREDATLTELRDKAGISGVSLLSMSRLKWYGVGSNSGNHWVPHPKPENEAQVAEYGSSFWNQIGSHFWSRFRFRFWEPMAFCI